MQKLSGNLEFQVVISLRFYDKTKEQVYFTAIELSNF